jgi:transposase
MYYSVKALLDLGKHISHIARELGIDRKTVRKIKKKIEEGNIKTPTVRRKSILDTYKEEIVDYLKEGISAVLIHQKLKEKHGLNVSYSAVKRYVKKIKPSEPFIPLISPPGRQAQVDFGYAGYFYNSRKNKKVKYWVFSMVLSHSRYRYYELVEDQSIPTFISCHINAFEYFGGSPKVVKIDNLKSGVLHTNFYEPQIQHEYSTMLSYYSSSAVACRVRKPNEKGKVESSVKYVKNNFLKSIRSDGIDDIDTVKEKLKYWQDNICNSKLHGTTRKIPKEEYLKEKEHLNKLPQRRYEIYEVSKRTVNAYGHIYFKYNYYSVPYKLIGEKLNIRANGKVVEIYNSNYDLVATHKLSKSKGEFITQESHKPDIKKNPTDADYANMTLDIGKNAHLFYKRIRKEKPASYHRVMQGVRNLTKSYPKETREKAFKRALKYNCIGYLQLKNILKNELYLEDDSPVSAVCGGFDNPLKAYDEMIESHANISTPNKGT